MGQEKSPDSEADANNPNSMLAVALFLERSGEVEKAEAELSRIVRQWPEEIQATCRLAQLLQKRKAYDSALVQWQHALTIEPSHPQALRGMATTLEQLNRLDEAKELFQQIAASWPDDPKSRIYLARIQKKQGDKVGAHQQWQEIINDFPDTLQVTIAYALFLERQGQLEEAGQWFDQAVKQWPEDSRGWWGRARVSMLHDDPQTALNHWKTFATRFPQEISALLGLAGCLESVRLFDQADALYDQIIASWPDDLRAWCGKARIGQKRFDPQKALQMWQKVVAKFPEAPRPALEMAIFLRQHGHYDHAFTLAEKVLQQQPTHIKARTTYFDLLLSTGRNEQALQIMEKWFQETPSHPDILSRYTNILKIFEMDERVNHTLISHGHENMDLIGSDSLYDALFNRSDEFPINDTLTRNLWVAWRYADHAKWSWSAWRRAAIWGVYANWILRMCVEGRPDLLPKLDEMIIPPCQETLNQALSQGKGCLLAGTHHGPNNIPPYYFHQYDHPFHTVGATGQKQIKQKDSSAIFIHDQNRKQAYRKLMKQLKSGAICALVYDHAPSFALERPFLNGRIKVSPLIPRLAYRMSIPSLSCKAVWQDQKIAIQLFTLPTPDRGESEDDFIDRWFSVVLKDFAQQLCGPPENISFGPLWRIL
ncbi:MAG: tetratricopeptide repeat protein [Magnetococcales bacterium]|nr:tetratricopeptide repeat protein [Magnetococcales bacterium]